MIFFDERIHVGTVFERTAHEVAHHFNHMRFNQADVCGMGKKCAERFVQFTACTFLIARLHQGEQGALIIHQGSFARLLLAPVNFFRNLSLPQRFFPVFTQQEHIPVQFTAGQGKEKFRGFLRLFPVTPDRETFDILLGNFAVTSRGGQVVHGFQLIVRIGFNHHSSAQQPAQQFFFFYNWSNPADDIGQ